MKEVTIKYIIGDDELSGEQQVIRALKINEVYRAIEEVGNEIFRPARKHGYSNPRISLLIEQIDNKQDGVTCEQLIGLLEDSFYEILKYHDVVLSR